MKYMLLTYLDEKAWLALPPAEQKRQMEACGPHVQKMLAQKKLLDGSPLHPTSTATTVRYVTPPAPVYPAQSQRMKEQGRVLLRVEIGADGRARQVLVSRSSGHARLDESAASAVRQARFAPYTENGVPLVVWTNVPIDFELTP